MYVARPRVYVETLHRGPREKHMQKEIENPSHVISLMSAYMQKRAKDGAIYYVCFYSSGLFDAEGNRRERIDDINSFEI